MGRKKGFDERKIAAIIGILYANPDGIWIRRIAREANLDHKTVSKYIDTVLKPLVEDVSLTGEKRAMLRVIKLKPFVVEKLAEGRNIQQILKVLRLMSKAGE